MSTVMLFQCIEYVVYSWVQFQRCRFFRATRTGSAAAASLLTAAWWLQSAVSTE